MMTREEIRELRRSLPTDQARAFSSLMKEFNRKGKWPRDVHDIINPRFGGASVRLSVPDDSPSLVKRFDRDPQSVNHLFQSDEMRETARAIMQDTEQYRRQREQQIAAEFAESKNRPRPSDTFNVLPDISPKFQNSQTELQPLSTPENEFGFSAYSIEPKKRTIPEEEQLFLAKNPELIQKNYLTNLSTDDVANRLFNSQKFQALSVYPERAKSVFKELTGQDLDSYVARQNAKQAAMAKATDENRKYFLQQLRSGNLAYEPDEMGVLKLKERDRMGMMQDVTNPQQLALFKQAWEGPEIDRNISPEHKLFYDLLERDPQFVSFVESLAQQEPQNVKNIKYILDSYRQFDKNVKTERAKTRRAYKEKHPITNWFEEATNFLNFPQETNSYDPIYNDPYFDMFD